MKLFYFTYFQHSLCCSSINKVKYTCPLSHGCLEADLLFKNDMRISGGMFSLTLAKQRSSWLSWLVWPDKMILAAQRSGPPMPDLRRISKPFPQVFVRETRIAQKNPQTMVTVSQTETQTRIRTIRV